MKYTEFITKLISLVVIIGSLASFQVVANGRAEVEARIKAEQKAAAKAEAERKKAEAKAAAEQAAATHMSIMMRTMNISEWRLLCLMI